MNRILKLRTYHKLLNEFVPTHKHVIINQYGEIVPSEFVDLTEYSGMNETIKDGEEIYEGDFVEACEYKERKGVVYVGEVIFYDCAFSLLIKLIKNHNDNGYVDYDIGNLPELDNFSYLKIIGDKYHKSEFEKSHRIAVNSSGL